MEQQNLVKPPKLYSGTPSIVALSQGLICTKRVHLGLSKAAFILTFTSGVAFMKGSTLLANSELFILWMY